MQIECIDDIYTIKDSTDSGAYYWVSEWDSECNMILLLLDGCDATKILNDRKSVNHYRSIRTKTRHLRFLQEELGMQMERKHKEKQLLTLDKGIYGQLTPVEVKQGVVHAKTVDIYSWRHKKRELFHAEYTSERAIQVYEYNQKLAEFLAYQRRALAEIFGEDQIQDWNPNEFQT
jgi:hypothetical protein